MAKALIHALLPYAASAGTDGIGNMISQVVLEQRTDFTVIKHCAHIKQPLTATPSNQELVANDWTDGHLATAHNPTAMCKNKKKNGKSSRYLDSRRWR